MVRTKIISTLGPSTNSATILRKMMLAGLDVVRLNFSHGSHEAHLKRMRIVRSLNEKYRRHIRILQDLEGFRIRIGHLRQGPIDLNKREIVFLANKKITKDAKAIPLDYDGHLTDVSPGSFIYIDDGNIALLTKSRTKTRLKAEVVIPGILKEHKGVNIPGIKLKFKDLTKKDKADLAFGLNHGVDFIAQSFVRNRQDIINIRSCIKDSDTRPQIIAKIENHEGIRNIDSILDVVDGIMVARGDMGVSLPIYQVPVIQKMIIKKCNKRKKFVITATQMLESMTEHLRPTRAEVSDVANAILDGSDYLMLSGETAVGLYPLETVRMMNDIIKFTEKSLT